MVQDSPLLRRCLLALILIASTLLVYYGACSGGFVWDDDYYVTRNPLLTAPDGLRRIWFSLDSPSQYFPLTYTIFRFEREWWGLNPTGYHWVNLGLHIANALLVWRLLERLRVPGAFLAAMIFALHPVQVESVAWITELKNVLMGLFFLLTLLAWIEFVDDQRKRRWPFYGLALLLYMFALSAKSTACTLPAALLLILWLQNKPITKGRLMQVTPFLLLGLGAGMIAVWWERYHQGTRGVLFALNPIERLLVASRAFWFYLGKLFWPADLTFIYPQWKIVATDPLAYLWTLAALGLCVAIYFGRRLVGRSLEVAIVFFVATMAPLLGFIMLYTFRYTFVADHYQYLACIGPIALVAAGTSRLGKFGKGGRAISIVLASLALALLGWLTWRQSSTYRNIETLWRTTLARNPECWMAYNNLGITLAQQGNVAEAVQSYKKSIALHADYAEAHYNLGNALLQRGEVDEAIVECRKALALRPNDPDAHVALGTALLAKGAVDESIAEYGTALRLRPEDGDAHYNLGNALQQKGEITAAMAHYERALQIAPDIVEAHLNMGNVLLQQEDEREAIEHYEKALKISPSSAKAQNNLGWALVTVSDRSLRNPARGLELAQKANGSLPNNSTVLHTLAAALAENGQFDRSVETARRALELAVREGDEPLAQELRRELELYGHGLPYRKD